MLPLDLDRFRALVAGSRARFAAAAPYPHVVIDDFLDEAAADALAAEFARVPDAWTYYRHVNEQKRGFKDLARMSTAARAVVERLQSPDFVQALEVLTGIRGLFADPELDGGGLHETMPGGFLNVHHDFLSHTTHPQWSRQLNLLVFLNRDWQEAYAGWLELWDAPVTRAVERIAPVFNRAVIFRTDRHSFHGAPAPVACPPGETRKSLALYYFRDEGRACELAPTHYVPRPGDPRLRRALIRIDRWVLYGYSALKRYTPIGDRVASAILRRLSR
jgi:Rps23 Pro-64 3,4-dihydroxylase Tpa1-like proline 4-hydroxylase